MSQWKEHRLAGVLITIFAAVCWGFSGTCSEFMFKTRGVSSEWLTMSRMLVAGLLLLAYARAKGHGHRVVAIWKSPDWKRLIAFSVLGLMTCQYTYLATISFTNSGTATILQYAAPVLVLAYSCLCLRRWPTPLETVSIVAVMIGVFLLATHGRPTNLVISRQGLLWGLLSAFAYAAYMLLPGRLLTKWGSTIVTGWGLFIGGTVFTLLFTLLFRPYHEAITWDFGMLFGLFGLIIIGTAMSFAIYLYGVALIGPVRASMLACMEPVSAALFSHFWLGTPFTPMDILGFAVILLAVLLLSAMPAKRPNS